jgi:methyl-accepting chemotaxis protein
MKDTLVASLKRRKARWHVSMSWVCWTTGCRWNQLEGDYRAMGQSINSLVASHIAVTMKVVEVVSAYSAGRFEVAMDRLPGQKARISEALGQGAGQASRMPQAAAQRNLRIKTALDRCTTNVMIADTDFNIIYLNETVSAMMQRNEAELRKVLPQFDAQATCRCQY